MITAGYSAFCLDRHLDEARAFRQSVDHIRLLVDEPGNLSVIQALQLYALCLEVRPDLIIELGRGYGNSSCIFAHAIRQLGAGRVVSFDLDLFWQQTSSKLEAAGLAWINRLVDARVENCKQADFGALAAGAQSVLVFWDAHGWDAADGVLANLLPAIAARRHIVACHDLSDCRFVAVDRSYAGRTFWRGPEQKEKTARYTIGWVNTQEPQFLPLLDFLWRNECELRSADEDLAIWRRDHAERQAKIERELGEEIFRPGCHWGYFSLNDAKADKLHFPARP